MTRTAPNAGLRADLAFHRDHLVPNLLQGLFVRRPFWVRLFSRLGGDRRTVRLLGKLKRRHGGLFRLRVFKDRALVVCDAGAIRQVLERSPAVYGPPEVKVKGMARFEPGAATISTGDEWRRRRWLNEAALDTGRPVHRLAGGWLEMIREEVDRTRSAAGGTLRWEHLAALFERLALGVVLGPAARGETALTADLGTLMRSANLPVGKGKPEVLERFLAAIRRHLAEPLPGGLIAATHRAAAEGGGGDGAAMAPEGQVPHWLFALKDTLGVNTARALAIVGSHPHIEERVRRELAAADPGSPEGIAALEQLGAVLHEAMRLWPTTPLLARRALADDEIDGVAVAAGSQVVIPNLFNHRDVEPHPDACYPDRWLGGGGDPRCNHLSGGAQSCAGAELALLVGRAALAGLLADRWTLAAPRLDPGRPLPYALDPFALRWKREPG
jgi:cytochrome P450